MDDIVGLGLEGMVRPGLEDMVGLVEDDMDDLRLEDTVEPGLKDMVGPGFENIEGILSAFRTCRSLPSLLITVKVTLCLAYCRSSFILPSLSVCRSIFSTNSGTHLLYAIL